MDETEFCLTKNDLYDFCQGLYDINTLTKYAELGKFPSIVTSSGVRFTEEAKKFMEPLLVERKYRLYDQPHLIYMLTNKVNGKKYVGVTCRSLKKRMNQHRHRAKKDNSPLYRALSKYGEDSFEQEIIDTSVGFDDAGKKEKHYIAVHNSRHGSGYGYNLTDGGEGCLNAHLSDETKANISKRQTGEGSYRFGMRGEKSPNFGMKQSDESKRMMSINASKNKKVVVGEKEFINIRYAAEHFGVTRQQVKHLENFYLGIFPKHMRPFEYKGQVFLTMPQAVETLNLPKTSLFRKVNDESCDFAKYLARTVTFEELLTYLKLLQRHDYVGSGAKVSKPVEYNGIVYESMLAAYNTAKVSYETFKKMMSEGKAKFV